MKVKTRIVFEVEYPLNLDFYNADEAKALEMERTLVEKNPLEIIDAFGVKGQGSFSISVEKAVGKCP